MNLSFSPRMIALVSGLALISFSKIAVSEETKSETPSTESASPVSEVPNQITGKVISDGSAVMIEKLGIKINPPKDWEVISDNGSLSLIMQEQPRDKDKAKEGEVFYQRNITVAAIHKPSPIDETRAKELKEELVKKFSMDSSITNYQALEHKFFNYKGTNDGLVVYSGFTLGEYNLMQMHVLVSGQEKQFLLTYTDLAEEFTKNTPSFEAAWNSIVSIEVQGEAPARFNDAIRWGGLAFGVILLFGVFSYLRYKSATRDYEKEADEIYKDNHGLDSDALSSIQTKSVIWNLKTANGYSFNSEYHADTEGDDRDSSADGGCDGLVFTTGISRFA